MPSPELWNKVAALNIKIQATANEPSPKILGQLPVLNGVISRPLLLTSVLINMSVPYSPPPVPRHI